MKPLRLLVNSLAASTFCILITSAAVQGADDKPPPLEPAPLVIDGAPPPRKLSEVKAILGDKLTAAPDPNAKALRIVLCASEKDPAHGKPGYHDYPLWRSRWSQLLALAKG